MTNHLNHILERLSKEEFTLGMEDEDFQSLVDKYTSIQYANMLDILYDYMERTDLKSLCFKLHGMNEEEIQTILQAFTNDGLINTRFDMNIVPSLSKLGYSIHYNVKCIQKTLKDLKDVK
mgnify:CR=1 FL=1